MTEQQKFETLDICKMCLNTELVNSEKLCRECARELE